MTPQLIEAIGLFVVLPICGAIVFWKILELIADQYEPKCNLLIPSIARTALNATGAYGQKESPESWPTEAMVTAFAELFNVRAT